MSKIFRTTPPGSAKIVLTPSRLRHSMRISAPVSFMTAPPSVLPKKIWYRNHDNAIGYVSSRRTRHNSIDHSEHSDISRERCVILSPEFLPVNSSAGLEASILTGSPPHDNLYDPNRWLGSRQRF